MKNILVTGTSSGIGLVTAKLLAANGFHVYANVRDPDHLDIWKGVENVTPVLFDVRNQDSISKVADKIPSPLYAIVNNAGISAWTPMLDCPMDKFDDIVRTNVYGPLHVYKTFFHKLDPKDARIINISSVSGKLIFPFMGPYHVSKSALETLSDSMRREHLINGMKHIKVTIIEPGSVDTRLWERARTTTIFPKSSPFYQTAINMGHGIIEQEMRGAFPPSWIASAVLKNLNRKNPKIREIVSPQKWIFKVLMLIPDWLFDKLFLIITKKFIKKK